MNKLLSTVLGCLSIVPLTAEATTVDTLPADVGAIRLEDGSWMKVEGDIYYGLLEIPRIYSLYNPWLPLEEYISPDDLFTAMYAVEVIGTDGDDLLFGPVDNWVALGLEQNPVNANTLLIMYDYHANDYPSTLIGVDYANDILANSHDPGRATPLWEFGFDGSTGLEWRVNATGVDLQDLLGVLESTGVKKAKLNLTHTYPTGQGIDFQSIAANMLWDFQIDFASLTEIDPVDQLELEPFQLRGDADILLNPATVPEPTGLGLLTTGLLISLSRRSTSGK